MTDRSAPLIFIRLTFFFSFFGFFTLNLVATHGVVNGIHLALLGWSVYVLCLPFLGGGALLYPLFRPLFALPSYGWELMAWSGALVINTITYYLRPSAYELTPVTHFLMWVFEHPFPYWGIFLLSFLPALTFWIYSTGRWPYRALSYYQLRFILIIISLLFLWYVAMHDMIILSNIHG